MAVIVTDHAAERFLERYTGMVPEAIRQSPARVEWARARIQRYWDSYPFGPPELSEAEAEKVFKKRTPGDRVFGDLPHAFLARPDDPPRHQHLITYLSRQAEDLVEYPPQKAWVKSSNHPCAVMIRMLGKDGVLEIAREHPNETARAYGRVLRDQWKRMDVDDLMNGCPQDCRAGFQPCSHPALRIAARLDGSEKANPARGDKGETRSR